MTDFSSRSATFAKPNGDPFVCHLSYKISVDRQAKYRSAKKIFCKKFQLVRWSS